MELTFRRPDDVARLSAEDFAVQIANDIPTAGGSLGLHAEMRLTGPTTRPDVFLLPSQHRLYTEQTHGIDEHRVSEYAALFA